jgi:hypothetical protein
MTDQVKAGEQLAKQGPQNMATVDRPSFIGGGKAGTEHITKDDIQLPRLGLAQGLSPQIDSSKAEYIPGLQQGQFFNTLTQQSYGEGPIPFMVLAGYAPRYIEFYPRKEGGGVKDFNVPANDPRCQFQPNGDPPLATKFYDFAIYLLNTEEIVMLSLKSTSLKVARQLNTLIGQRQADIYAGQYSLTRAKEKNKKGEYWQFAIKNAGWAPDEDTYAFAKSKHEDLKDKKVTTNYADVDPADENGHGDVVDGTVEGRM